MSSELWEWWIARRRNGEEARDVRRCVETRTVILLYETTLNVSTQSSVF